MSMKNALIGLFGEAAFERSVAQWKHSKRSFSQFGEDVHVAAFYERLAHDRGIFVANGMVVDVGAFRPIVHSNTYALYRRGWKCINIDPTPGSKSRFDAVRPRDINLEIAIAPQEGEGTFYVFGNPSVWNTMDAAAAQVASTSTGTTPAQIRVPIRRLSNVLREHMPDPNLFEMLSIDAEGYDVEILDSSDFATYRPRIVLIEVHDLVGEEIAQSAVFKFLAEAGYELYSWINPNLMFVRADSALKISTSQARVFS